MVVCVGNGWICEECLGDGYISNLWQKKFGVEIVYHMSCVCDSLPFIIRAKF
jgi:hypothetical protein